jgi:hypothetical protein
MAIVGRVPFHLAPEVGSEPAPACLPGERSHFLAGALAFSSSNQGRQSPPPCWAAFWRWTEFGLYSAWRTPTSRRRTIGVPPRQRPRSGRTSSLPEDTQETEVALIAAGG